MVIGMAKACKVCGKVMISNSDLCSDCRSKKLKVKEMKYIRKNATFNQESERHMAIWEWCLRETEDFKAQNFADFIREKLEWCMNHGNVN